MCHFEKQKSILSQIYCKHIFEVADFRFINISCGTRTIVCCKNYCNIVLQGLLQQCVAGTVTIECAAGTAILLCSRDPCNNVLQEPTKQRAVNIMCCNDCYNSELQELAT